MKKRWGSCAVNGAITLSPALVKAPRECIDYVIVHELCHLREHNHSPAYYQLLARAYPNWEATKRKLDDLAEILLNA
jgi:predicted metal-dependent hydrolase